MTLARRPEAGCDARTERGGEAARPVADVRPTRLSERVATRRTFGVLMLGALLGVVGLQPYALALTSPQLPPGSPPLGLLIAAGVLQSLVLVAGATVLGLWLGPTVGLGAPLLRAWVMGDRDAPGRFRAQIAPAVLAGAVSSAAVLVLEVFVFAPRTPPAASGIDAPAAAPWQGLLAAFYGGIVEELLLRLGLMTVLVWLGVKLTRATRPSSAVLWSANTLAAVLFGLGHLPTTAALVALTPPVIARTLVLNGLAGVVFGWLYWRRGLLAAMVAHFTFDLVVLAIVPALRGGA